jgi:hypothetical protein
MRIARLIGIFLISINFCFAQKITKDTIPSGNLADTLVQDNRPVEEIESYAKRYDPRKALFYSAIVPGMGQAYNKKYWKMPFVYGGFGFLIYVDAFYQSEYLKYREQLFEVVNDPSLGGVSSEGLTEDQLRNLVNQSRRERDFFLIITGFWYILQMVDAHIDSHLKEFDLNPKLQVRIEPLMENNLQMGRSTGVALKIRF